MGNQRSDETCVISLDDVRRALDLSEFPEDDEGESSPSELVRDAVEQSARFFSWSNEAEAGHYLERLRNIVQGNHVLASDRPTDPDPLHPPEPSEWTEVGVAEVREGLRNLLYRFQREHPRITALAEPTGQGNIATLESAAAEIIALVGKRLERGDLSLGPQGILPRTPEQERDYIAKRLGRTRGGLDSFVSLWKAENFKDLPWVVRKPGLPWLPDLQAFERWRTTPEGSKATIRPRRGRPVK